MMEWWPVPDDEKAREFVREALKHQADLWQTVLTYYRVDPKDLGFVQTSSNVLRRVL